MINGLKRSLTSPKRLITTLVIVGYYLWLLTRPLMSASVPFNSGLPERLKFPPLDFLDAVVFSGFAGLSLLLALSLFGYRSSFKPADVDVLFPTPVSPRLVLLFRICRDFLATLLVPIIIIMLTWRPLQIDQLFRDVPHPQSAGYAFRALSLGFMLITTCWVSMGYALSLYVNRNDSRSELRKRIIAWAIAVPCLGVVAYIVQEGLKFHSIADFVSFAQQTWLRGFFFTATPATNLVMGPMEGNSLESIVGALTLVGISGVALYLALKQADWMYDQAAVKGFGAESIRELQRKADFMGIVAESARRGKIKVRKPGWYQRLRVKGFMALLWKDVLIQWRSVRAMVILLFLVGLMFLLMPYLGGIRGRREGVGYLLLTSQGFVAFMVATMTSQSGFTELLRRVDLQKPLPFGPQAIVLSEVLSKALPAMLIPLLCSLIGLTLYPSTWPQVLAGALFFPTLAAVICALVCVIVLLFPEIDDVSQRGFRGIMMLIGLCVVGTPGVLAFVGVGILAKAPVIGAIPGALINVGVAFGLTAIGGSLYAAFNPSE